MPEGRRERADAARNREAILRAAEELLRDHPPQEITMERVAAAAGVGKGTVFHRFGNRMGLITALAHERARTLHQDFLTGPPPLGPATPPRERLLAYLAALVALIARNKGLAAALDHAAATRRPHHDTDPTDHPIYLDWHADLTALLAASRPDLDADVTAHILLSTVTAGPILRLFDSGDAPRVAAALRTIAATLTAPGPRVPDRTAPRPPTDDGADGSTDDNADEGGDPACWLDRVCPHCGAIPDAGPPPAVCPRCGTLREDGPREDGPSDNTPGGRAAAPPADPPTE